MENIFTCVSTRKFIPVVTLMRAMCTWKEYLLQSNEINAVLQVSAHIFQEKLTALDCTGVFIVNAVTKYMAVKFLCLERAEPFCVSIFFLI
jgi:hypothetical protein